MKNNSLILAIGISLLSSPLMATPKSDAVTQSFADKMGVTYDEAAQKLALRMESIEVLNNLDTSITSRFAGKEFSENPTVITIRLKGSDPVAPRLVRTAHGTISLVFISGASHSLDDLRTIIDSGQVQQLFPEAHGIGIDGKSGEIYVDLPNEYLDTTHERARENASRILGVPMQLRKSKAPVRHLSSPPLRAGGTAVNNNSYCTFGFRAYDSNDNPGLITAGHCLPQMRYESLPTAGETVSVVLNVDAGKRRLDGSSDVQWHPVPASIGDATWTIFSELNGSDSIGYLGKVRSDLLIPNAEDILFLCHRGSRTGWSCGTLVDVDHLPLGDVCGQETCRRGWAKIADLEGPYDLKCDEGDSGGPVFTTGYDAVAIVTSALSSGPQAGQCEFLVAMSVGKIPEAIGVTVR